MTSTDWDINQYKIPFEPLEHWELKKEFMTRHKDKFPEHKLVCLAQVYVNVILLGCKYPSEVMQQMSNLGEGLGTQYVARKKQLLQRHFVQASDAAQQKVQRRNFNGNIIKSNSEDNDKSFVSVLKKPCISFVSASNTGAGEDSGEAPTPRVHQPWFNEECQKQRRITRVAYRRMKKNPTPLNVLNYKREMAVKDRLIKQQKEALLAATAAENENKESEEKKDSSTSSIEDTESEMKEGTPVEEDSNKFKKTVFDLDKTTSTDGLNNLTTINPNRYYKRQLNQLADKIRAKEMPENILDVFFIMDKADLDPTPMNILHQSAQFSQLVISYMFEEGEGEDADITCRCYLHDILIGCGIGSNQKLAKKRSAENALEQLLQKCWTLKQCRIHCSEEEKMSLEEVVDEDVSKASKGSTTEKASVHTEIQDSNKGMQLMKLMGWSGGGLGKEGEGIVEPINPATFLGRCGLGSRAYQVSVSKCKNMLPENKFSNIEQHYQPANTVDSNKFGGQDIHTIDNYQFRRSASVILEQFAHNFDMEDLAFTPEFTNEQRKAIHEICRRYRLRSRSYGKGNRRFLVVSKKRDWKDLIAYVIDMGGKTEKFELLLPGQSTLKPVFE